MKNRIKRNTGIACHQLKKGCAIDLYFELENPVMHFTICSGGR